MSLASSVDMMLILAEDIHMLAISFMQLPSLNEHYSLYAEHMMTTSQRLIDILAVGVGCRETEQIRHFSHDCRAPLSVIHGYSELCHEIDLVPLPPHYTTILQQILENVHAIQECLDDLNDDVLF